MTESLRTVKPSRLLQIMKKQNNNLINARIRSGLLKLSSRDAGYWEFRRQAQRDGLHGLLQYPAMMVPQMQGDILDTILTADPTIETIWDPFVGAGTTLTEAMIRGRDFVGFDINPLSVLTCEAKSDLFRSDQLERKVLRLFTQIENDNASSVDVDFAGRDKWFSLSTSRSISKVRRAIIKEPAYWARKIMWIVLCETIRKTSNSRNSTYKLHLLPRCEQKTKLAPEVVFSTEMLGAVQKYKFHQEMLESKGLLLHGRYTKKIRLICADTKLQTPPNGYSGFDLIITSPPYGDNRTTIPYGQFSYLSLNWIPKDELPGEPSFYANTQATDYRSLGGSVRGFEEKVGALIKISKSYKMFYSHLSALHRRDLLAKVSSFLFDFHQSLEKICLHLKPGGLAVWTLGNRTVGGLPVPLYEFCREVQEGIGLRHIATVQRKIPCKRSPSRNSKSNTIGNELLLVMRN